MYLFSYLCSQWQLFPFLYFSWSGYNCFIQDNFLCHLFKSEIFYLTRDMMMKKKGREFACLISSVSNFFLCQTDPIRVSLLSFPSFLPQGDWISFFVGSKYEEENNTHNPNHLGLGSTELSDKIWISCNLNFGFCIDIYFWWTFNGRNVFYLPFKPFNPLQNDNPAICKTEPFSNNCCPMWALADICCFRLIFSAMVFASLTKDDCLSFHTKFKFLRLSLQLLLLILPIFWRWRKKPCSSGLLWKGR